MECGLLGRKLSHSYSPQIHKFLGDYTYTLHELEEDQLGEFLQNGCFTGLNVTIPHKKAVIPYCTELTDCAKKVGAVNTIVRKDNRLIGHNTDYYGFYSMLMKSGLDIAHKKVLVLGSGGAAVTVITVLKELAANVVVISRNGENNYTNLHLHTDASLIVNTTPVGMYPNVGVSPVDIDLFPRLEGVLDLIYNPARTKLLLDAESKGIVTLNGLWMLVAQAKESAEWFTETKIPDSVIEEIYNTLSIQMQNIVLIGMPGSGKSTIGKAIAQSLHREFVDADAIIESRAGMTIPEIFSKSGETLFRQLETRVLADIGKESSLVIATGGGCVTQECNYGHLHQNSLIIWLQREVNKLPTDGRPLSQTASLEKMYELRRPLYAHCCDIILDNNGDPGDTVAALRQIIIKGNKQ